ncbi:MAG: Zn-dependent oligopeptidase [Elusimicrobia bacterium]|nr:Zn-dependent oligopeptidase [Elusimicrobiota bacterium]
MNPAPFLITLLLPLAVSAQVVRGPSAPGGGAPALPAITFGATPETLRADYAAATARLDGELAKILAAPQAQASFGTVIVPFEEATAAWQRAIYPLIFMSSVSPDKAVREAARALENEVGAYAVSLSHREDIYQALEAAAAKKEALSPADAKLLEITLRGYRDNGFALKPEDRAKLKAMQEKLVVLQNEFARNIDETKEIVALEPASTKGLPEAYLAALARDGQGRYLLPVDESTLPTFMRYADDAGQRKVMLAKFTNRGGERNLAVLKEGLELRRDIAKLLGYETYPQFALKDRMVGTPEKALAFLNRVKDAVVERARKDIAELLEVKRRFEKDATQVFAWERAYFGRILKGEKYGVDTEEVRQYFPVERVVDGTLRVYQKTLGVTFREIVDGPRWAPGVRLFEITDAKTGAALGHFYLDLKPREGKHGHPAAYPLVSGRVLPDGTYEKPVAAMVADFPEPAPGQPSLLTHGDVETFFHEFGHLMHQTLTKARYASMSGSSTALDFVEAPSQMLEEFVFEKPVLDELSGHWKDGRPLPEDLIAKMVKARTFQEGVSWAAQVALAMGDLILHADVPADLSATFDKLYESLTGVPTQEGTHFLSSFDHLMGGYGAGYYGYLWSKVYALDMYSLFKADGVISPRVGARYREAILETGSERPEMDSLKDLLGREPSEEPFMRELRGEPEGAEAGIVGVGALSDAMKAAIIAARASVGPMPKGAVVEFIAHSSADNPLVRISIGGRTAYFEYLYHSESNLARYRRRWWNPLTWFAGLGAPSRDLGVRAAAVLTLAREAGLKAI